MKIFVSTLLLCFIVSSCFIMRAQDTSSAENPFAAIDDSVMATLPYLADIPALPKKIVIGQPSKASLQKRVSAYPKFPGGDEGLENWVEENLQYPREAYARAISESSYMLIHITAKGTVDSISMVDDLKYTLTGNYTLVDTIAWGLIGQMPRWQPALDMKGRPTDFWYYMGIKVDHPILEERARQESEKEWEEFMNGNILIELGRTRTQPEFPGGERAMWDWIQEQITYTPEMEGLKGRVTTEIVIDSQGFIKDAKISRGRHPLLDAEALRIVMSSPRWIPAYLSTLTTDINYLLPITFK